MRFPRPFEENYRLTVTIAILAITPFIFVTTASQIIEQRVAADVGTNLTGISVLSGLAIAGYAFGALLAGDLIQRFPQRRLFFICEALFITGCAVAAGGRDLVMFGAGEVLAGFATGLLLVIALPPVVQRFPASRMPTTSAVINIGFFGAVTAGPLLGGAVSLADSWRALWIGIGALGVLAYFLAALTLPDKPPPKPDARFDKSAIVLSCFGTVLPFWASGELVGHGFGRGFYSTASSRDDRIRRAASGAVPPKRTALSGEADVEDDSAYRSSRRDVRRRHFDHAAGARRAVRNASASADRTAGRAAFLAECLSNDRRRSRARRPN